MLQKGVVSRESIPPAAFVSVHRGLRRQIRGGRGHPVDAIRLRQTREYLQQQPFELAFLHTLPRLFDTPRSLSSLLRRGNLDPTGRSAVLAVSVDVVAGRTRVARHVDNEVVFKEVIIQAIAAAPFPLISPAGRGDTGRLPELVFNPRLNQFVFTNVS